MSDATLSIDNHVLIERPADCEGVLVIRFNRPEKKNAITSSMYHRMTAALADANTDDTTRAVVFRGTEGCFSAGNDLNDFNDVVSHECSWDTPI